MSHCHTDIKLNIKLGGDLMDVDNLLLDSKVVPFFDEGEKAVCLMAATQVSFIGEHLSLSLLRTVVYQSPLNPNAW
ncbi:unnamed protein product [Brassica rapa subsp. narinosa]